jgi:hypothetical protein
MRKLMAQPRLRFFLFLFMAMTLLATLIAMWANHAAVAAIALVIVSPFLFAVPMAFLTNHTPILAHMTYVLIVVAAFLVLLAVAVGWFG